MKYRRLGQTGLEVSEIGLGAEWLERHTTEECQQVIDACHDAGINILDCWMSEPNVRSNIGKAIAKNRSDWYIQGHIGSTWQDGQYVRTRDMDKVVPAFEDLLERLGTDYIDLGMMHYIDTEEEYEIAMNGPYYRYVQQLKKDGIIHHIGMSSHNPILAARAVEEGRIENLLFSINPAFDLLPATDNLDNYFVEEYDKDLAGIAQERVHLYSLCEQQDVGITVMKGYAGGRLFDAKRSPFGVALTPIQCIHYALTRPAVAAIMVGYDDVDQVNQAVAYETATEEEKDYATVLAGAPAHAYGGECTYCGHCKPCPVDIDIALVNKFYDLATMQEEVPSGVAAHYRDLPVKAGSCIGCQSCESRCPFGVPIASRMAQAKELFGE